MGIQYRARWHDYTKRCIYLITLIKSPEVEYFGALGGNVSIPPGQVGCSFVISYRIGNAIKRALREFYEIESCARVLQYAIMPDHLHFLLFIQEPTKDTLGSIIARFKVKVDKIAGITHVFAKGFNDQILKTSRNLNTIFNYLRSNPHRLAMRKSHPEYLRRINALKIGGNSYQAYGNFQLLDCPFKEQVVIHRADTADERERKRQLWTYTAANGGVLVSPFISKAEKEVRSDAEVAGGRFILIVNEPMEERYKPSGHDFELCEAGRLLIISANLSGDISRQMCLTMNSLAETIAKN